MVAEQGGGNGEPPTSGAKSMGWRTLDVYQIPSDGLQDSTNVLFCLVLAQIWLDIYTRVGV